MRHVITRGLAILCIAAAFYGLNMKLDLLPALADSEDIVRITEQDITEQQLRGSEGEELTALAKLELELAAGFQSRAQHFSVKYTGDKEQLSAAMKETIRSALDHDDYSAYVLESYLYTIRSWGSKSTITIEARYRETTEESAYVSKKLDEVLAQLIKPDMNDHEKVKVIHDWVVTNVAYDESLTYYTAYQALTRGETVCQGYSLLGYLMLKKAGLPVRIAEGSVNTGEHAWNMVMLDGIWYHLDLTWDDPVGTTDNRIRYSYYLKSDAEMQVDHSWTREYPVANNSYVDTLQQLSAKGTVNEQQKYTRLKEEVGLHWLEAENTVSNEEELTIFLQRAVEQKSTTISFRYIDRETFPTDLKQAFKALNRNVGYRASYEPYGSDNSLLVSLQIEYP